MNIVHTAVYALLGTAIVFSIIELGLSSYVMSLYGKVEDFYSDDSYFDDFDYDYDIDISAPPIVAFSIFASVWTLLVAGGSLAMTWFFSRRGPVSRSLNMILGAALLVVYFVTMVFWLGDFADIAYLFGISIYASDYANAMVAFAVLLWLIFLGLLVVTVLAILGIFQSDWAGYSSFRHRPTDPQGAQAAREVPTYQAYQPGAELGQVKHEGNPAAA